MASNYKIGSSLGTLTSLDLLATPIVDPKHVAHNYSSQDDLADGSVRGMGWPFIEWRYGYVTQAQRDMFRTFCPSSSSIVYIRTKQNESADGFKTYRAVMIWPLNEDKRAGRRMDFILMFRQLLETGGISSTTAIATATGRTLTVVLS